MTKSPAQKKKAVKNETVLVVAQLNDRAQPIDRGDLYEDPLSDVLEEKGLGDVSGGGTLLGELGEISLCELEIRARNVEKETIKAIVDTLEKLGAPKGSKLMIEGQQDIAFGKLEGMAIYFNGTELPDNVYQECDINHVCDEFNRLLGKEGKMHSAWDGPRETALYLYGKSFKKMNELLADFIRTYPLCEKARIVQIA